MLFAAAVALSAMALRAQDTPAKDMPQGMSGGCELFKWPLDKERTAFDGSGLEKLGSGTARGPWKEQAFELGLVPEGDVAYSVKPGKRKDASTQHGGVVAFAPPEKDGVYQVTLSAEGWIDLVQNGAPLDSADHSGAKNCPGLRKSVRFNVGAAPVVLQISGAPAESVKVAIRPAE